MLHQSDTSGSFRELIVFAKEPSPGQVKTRLAAIIGDDRAARIYSAFIRLVLQRCVSPGGEWQTVVSLAPDDATQRAHEFLPGDIALRPQGSGDLGERLKRALTISWQAGMRQIIMIGSDCPLLSAADIVDAFALLERGDAVIGPAVDGGYYLIGFNTQRCEPLSDVLAVFDGIDWSTNRVYEQTIAQLKHNGHTYTELPAKCDVDTYDDLVAVWNMADDDVRKSIGKIGELGPLEY